MLEEEVSLFRYDTYNDLAERREAITTADANATERKTLKIRNAIGNVAATVIFTYHRPLPP